MLLHGAFKRAAQLARWIRPSLKAAVVATLQLLETCLDRAHDIVDVRGGLLDSALGVFRLDILQLESEFVLLGLLHGIVLHSLVETGTCLDLVSLRVEVRLNKVVVRNHELLVAWQGHGTLCRESTLERPADFTAIACCN